MQFHRVVPAPTGRPANSPGGLPLPEQGARQPLTGPERSVGLRALTYSAGDAAVIAVEGWLDLAAVATLDRAIVDALERGWARIVLDLHQLRRIDADAVCVLWAGLRGATRRGVPMTAAGGRPSLRPSLDPLVAHGLGMFETVQAAIAATAGADGSAT